MPTLWPRWPYERLLFWYSSNKQCHKTNHSSNKCFKNNPPARKKIHLGWIASWKWASTTKKIFQSYVQTCSKVLSSFVVEFSPSSHLVSDGGEVMVIYKLQIHIKQAWATTYHTRFRVVARDKDAPEHAFKWWGLFKELRTLPLAENFSFFQFWKSSRNCIKHSRVGGNP